MNLMLLNSPDWFEVRPGSCGRACPGRKVAIVDPGGHVLPPGEEGPDRRLAARPDRHAGVLAQPRGHRPASSPATGY
jgi:acyl-coenzyme A synthetase/AMP-(fatty) acid ligase